MNIDTLRTFKPKIQALAREYKIDPDSIRVFGSVARGDATADSDVDFLVHPQQDCNIFDISGFYEDVAGILRHPVDVVSDRTLQQKFVAHIQDDIIFL
ncbi:MAG: nucleotidyltransferase domain-containing protein [Alphaproteobacteria bacterium]|nr:nucleotidyltransferase domain-containing protein [Alphaproteobacteria bacterium]